MVRAPASKRLTCSPTVPRLFRLEDLSRPPELRHRAKVLVSLLPSQVSLRYPRQNSIPHSVHPRNRCCPFECSRETVPARSYLHPDFRIPPGRHRDGFNGIPVTFLQRKSNAVLEFCVASLSLCRL